MQAEAARRRPPRRPRSTARPGTATLRSAGPMRRSGGAASVRDVAALRRRCPSSARMSRRLWSPSPSAQRPRTGAARSSAGCASRRRPTIAELRGRTSGRWASGRGAASTSRPVAPRRPRGASTVAGRVKPRTPSRPGARSGGRGAASTRASLARTWARRSSIARGAGATRRSCGTRRSKLGAAATTAAPARLQPPCRPPHRCCTIATWSRRIGPWAR
mmetsp:Transcript_147206/g.472804  ORF Transcript_147206/g.472804 Transcript_147206/m.472804 type:complete len:218 (-) Transcript_147206:1630-2283(-)